MYFLRTHPQAKKKTDSIAISHSIIVAFSGGAKQQGRTANGPFGLQVKQPPKGGQKMIKKRAKYNVQCSL